MRGGNFDQRVRIERLDVVDDPDYGPQAAGWVVAHAEVWAEILDVLPSRSETQGHGIRIASQPSRVRMRYMPGITSDMRLVLLDQDDRTLKIVSGPAMIGRQVALEMMAEAFTTEGIA